MKFSQTKLALVAAVATLGSAAFAAGPTAGDLSSMVPDAATVLTGIGAVGVVLLGVNLAIKAYHTISALVKRG